MTTSFNGQEATEIMRESIPDGALGDDERVEGDPGGGGGGGDPRDSEGAMHVSDVNGDQAAPDPREASEGKSPSSPDGVNGKKKKHRRGKHKGGRHHRKWKPYTKMSWDERQDLEKRETERACLKREERMANGQPMAPYNTTQFLMEQHQPQDDFHLNEGGKPRLSVKGEGSGSVESSDEYYESPEDEEIFLEKDFTEAYENCHAERLQTMDKEQLIREYIDLEAKVEKLEARLKELGGCRKRMGSAGSPAQPGIGAEHAVDFGQATSMEAEIRRLKEANERLYAENQRLKSSIEGASHSC